MNDHKKKNPFKIPEGYFESFGRNLGHATFPEEIRAREKGDFQVPKGYFDTLNERIAQVTYKRGKEPVVLQLNRYRWYYTAAASVAAIFMLATLAVTLIFPGEAMEKLTFDDLASSDIEQYFELNEMDLSTYEIAEMIPVDQLEVSDILDSPFREENVIDYLNDHIDEFEDLNLENDE